MKKLLLALMLVFAVGFTYTPPANHPQMVLYTPEGYTIELWIYREHDKSCTFEYSIKDKVARLGHGKGPCEVWALWFNSIQERD